MKWARIIELRYDSSENEPESIYYEYGSRALFQYLLRFDKHDYSNATDTKPYERNLVLLYNFNTYYVVDINLKDRSFGLSKAICNKGEYPIGWNNSEVE